MSNLDSTVPKFTRLSQIYTNHELQEARYAKIKRVFTEKFNVEPQFFARSPGRVNIIGEHIDYAGYSVLPMALERDVVIAIAVFKNQHKPAMIHLSSSNPEKYPDSIFNHTETIVEIDDKIHSWSNYFKGPYKVIYESFPKRTPVSFYALVDGTVPAGGGVSSSSALSSCATVALLHILNIPLSLTQIAQLAISGERLAGVQTGGMDQSISIMGLRDTALLIDFVPELLVTPIPIPMPGIKIENYVFVVANTCVVSDKHSTAPVRYNLRVVEVRICAALLAKKLGLTFRNPMSLRGVSDDYLKVSILNGALDEEILHEGREVDALNVMIDVVEKCICKTPFTIGNIAQELCMSIAELKDTYIGDIVIRADIFELYKRAMHVYTEARRVFLFRDVTRGKVPYSGELLTDLGALMNASQDSCRELFNCSCPEIDGLVQICRKAGAFGSRLTGAGWGGCTVSLIAEKNLSEFINTLEREYYEKSEDYKMYGVDFKDVVFYCRPQPGSAIYQTSNVR